MIWSIRKIRRNLKITVRCTLQPNQSVADFVHHIKDENMIFTCCGDMHMNGLVTKNNSTTLRVDADRLVLDGPRKYRFVLPREQVTEIKQAIARFWKWTWPLKNGIRIYHSVPGAPEKLVFRSCDSSAREMLEKFEALKYCVP